METTTIGSQVSECGLLSGLVACRSRQADFRRPMPGSGKAPKTPTYPARFTTGPFPLASAISIGPRPNSPSSARRVRSRR